MPGNSRPLLHRAILPFLLLVFLWQMSTASKGKSTTSDERPHIAAGLSYLGTGDIQLNLEHPPLLKELSALFLTAAVVPLPQKLTIRLPDPDFSWQAGGTLPIDKCP